MRKKMGLCLLTLLTLAAAVPLPANATVPDQPGGKVADHPAVRGTGEDRIEPAVHAALARGEEPAVLIRFKGKADLSRAFGIADRDARATWVYETLRDFAARAQTEARETLRSRFGLSAEAHDYTVLWIDNAIAVARLGPALLASLESVAEIDSIRLQREIPLPVTERVEIPPRQPDAAESSLVQMRVPDVWTLGYKGSGLVVANIDSGVRHTHNALVNQYRGRQSGGTFVHDYNWYDPYNHSATPRTTHDHGTHTMGTMVGFDGGANQIGAAPEAKWMACIGFGQSGAGATDAGLLECGQWVLAPYPTSGSGSPNPALHADVVNNSWGDCGQTYDDWYEGVIDAWIAAGIAPLFSNGNNSNCYYPSNPPLNTVGNPARSGKVLGVGSTGRNNGAYANHSNKGPTDDPNPGLPTYPAPLGFPYLKPNVVAPGVNINSAYASGDAAYGGMTGTSMSAPNAAGVVALIWDAAACLKGDYAITGTILMQTARAIPVNTGSPHDGPGNVPNQATGWGEVDALSAVNAAIAFCSGGGFAPLVSKAFAPTPIVAGATSTLTIRLENLNASGATLTAALTDTFPAGIVTAAAPNAITTCGNGSVSTTAGSVTLASGAVIPASGSCTVRVDVTAAVDGSYLNTIPAGALQTDQGANAKAASATLKVGLTFPEPYPPVTFPSGVEPITNVTFAGIDNTTPATSSIPLEDFTHIIGNVEAGETYHISVEGNTMGAYTTYVNAFIDRNRNGAFEAGEEIQIGTIYNSTGTDGVKAELDITVPGTAVNGRTRMRVMKRWGGYGTPGNNAGYGQAEDYTLIIGEEIETFTVTPSVGNPAGTISPDTPQTVEEGETASFVLTPDASYEIDFVGGDCPVGTLDGAVYTTGAITADCTVIANFRPEAGPGPSVLEIPTLAPVGGALLGLALAGLGFGILRRRRA